MAAPRFWLAGINLADITHPTGPFCHSALWVTNYKADRNLILCYNILDHIASNSRKIPSKSTFEIGMGMPVNTKIKGCNDASLSAILLGAIKLGTCTLPLSHCFMFLIYEKCTHTHTDTQTYTHTYTCTHTHIYIYIYINKYNYFYLSLYLYIFIYNKITVHWNSTYNNLRKTKRCTPTQRSAHDSFWPFHVIESGLFSAFCSSSPQIPLSFPFH